MLAEQRQAEAGLKERFEKLSGELQAANERFSQSNAQLAAALAAVEAATRDLERERTKSDALLYQMLPPSVAEALRAGQKAPATQHPEVTILFSGACVVRCGGHGPRAARFAGGRGAYTVGRGARARGTCARPARPWRQAADALAAARFVRCQSCNGPRHSDFSVPYLTLLRACVPARRGACVPLLWATADIVSFTTIAAESSAMQICQMLDNLCEWSCSARRHSFLSPTHFCLTTR
jgi:hypothetical protein